MAAWRIALLGLMGVAVALFLERAGFELPFLRLPRIREGAGLADRIVGYLAISTAGLIQGAVLGGCVVALALATRMILGLALRRAPARIAARLDALLRTERFSAALEAEGPFAPLVEREALQDAPRPQILVSRRNSRVRRFLTLLALALVLVLAVLAAWRPGRTAARRSSEPPIPAKKRTCCA